MKQEENSTRNVLTLASWKSKNRSYTNLWEEKKTFLVNVTGIEQDLRLSLRGYSPSEVPWLRYGYQSPFLDDTAITITIQLRFTRVHVKGLSKMMPYGKAAL